jgi:hypothetical protein
MRATNRQLQLCLLPKFFAVCKLAPGGPVPEWATRGHFFSISRTDEELSIVAEMGVVPEHLRSGKNWRVMKVQGPFDLSEVGVLASLIVPLAQAGISIFTISTFDTDYLLVQSGQLAGAEVALRSAGHSIHKPESVL